MLTDVLQTEYDLVIAGGGLVGGSFALLLAAGARQLKKEQLRVLLVDSAPMRIDIKESGRPFDARSTALSWGSRLIYEEAGCWAALAPYVTAIDNIQVSDRGHMGST
ncbi:MAG TPA: 2-octaprenyl-6-methoxyphenyl hydroxylase, partial [Pseudohongiella sp.]|nr:2-octaprenyl-6-methoxyphenyl hydroxylase [Pseudohongiella sp.]